AREPGARDAHVDLADRLGVGACEGRHLLGDHLAAIVRDVERAGDHDRCAALEDLLVAPVGVRPGDDLDDAFPVLERERRVTVALLAVLEPKRVDHAAQANTRPRVRPAVPFPVARRQLPAAGPQGAGGRVRELPQVRLVAVERVTGDEEPDRLALGAALLLARPRGDAGGRRRRAARRPAGGEEPDLPGRALLGAACRPAHDVVEAGEQAGAAPLERVERAALDEALDHAPVDELAPDPEAEVREARERALLPRRDDRLDRLRPDALHSAEAE